MDLIPFVVALIAWIAVEVFARSTLVVGKRELSRSYLARSLIHDLNVFLGLALTGALFGELLPEIGWWALPIALLPYSFAHLAFKRFQETKVTYKQTIRALARIPEVSGLGVDGHADRTTELASAIAKEIGLGPVQVEDVEYAGLMHDIGRVSLNEPQILRMGYSDTDIARWSSEIIAESPYLSRVATHVRHQYEPYRKPGEQTDPDVSDRVADHQGCSRLRLAGAFGGSFPASGPRDSPHRRRLRLRPGGRRISAPVAGEPRGADPGPRLSLTPVGPSGLARRPGLGVGAALEVATWPAQLVLQESA